MSETPKNLKRLKNLIFLAFFFKLNFFWGRTHFLTPVPGQSHSHVPNRGREFKFKPFILNKRWEIGEKREGRTNRTLQWNIKLNKLPKNQQVAFSQFTPQKNNSKGASLNHLNTSFFFRFAFRAAFFKHDYFCYMNRWSRNNQLLTVSCVVDLRALLVIWAIIFFPLFSMQILVTFSVDIMNI